jgi:hypothetical protein
MPKTEIVRFIEVNKIVADYRPYITFLPTFILDVKVTISYRLVKKKIPPTLIPSHGPLKHIHEPPGEELLTQSLLSSRKNVG